MDCLLEALESQNKRTPVKQRFIASTPCAEPSLTLHNSFPSNVTPVAVKQLFDLPSRRNLTEYTWTSSLASVVPLDDLYHTDYMDPGSLHLSPTQLELQADEVSASLFSSLSTTDLQSHLNSCTAGQMDKTDEMECWAEKSDIGAATCSYKSDTDIKLAEGLRVAYPTVNQQSSDSLHELLKTPPTLKTRRFSVPRKRKGTKLDDSDDILSGIIKRPTQVVKSSRVKQLQCRSIWNDSNNSKSTYKVKLSRVLGCDSEEGNSGPSSALMRHHESQESTVRRMVPANTNQEQKCFLVQSVGGDAVPKDLTCLPLSSQNNKSQFLYPESLNTGLSTPALEMTPSLSVSKTYRKIQPHKSAIFKPPIKLPETEYGMRRCGTEQMVIDLLSNISDDVVTACNNQPQENSALKRDLADCHSDSGCKTQVLDNKNSKKLETAPCSNDSKNSPAHLDDAVHYFSLYATANSEHELSIASNQQALCGNPYKTSGDQTVPKLLRNDGGTLPYNSTETREAADLASSLSQPSYSINLSKAVSTQAATPDTRLDSLGSSPVDNQKAPCHNMHDNDFLGGSVGFVNPNNDLTSATYPPGRIDMTSTNCSEDGRTSRSPLEIPTKHSSRDMPLLPGFSTASGKCVKVNATSLLSVRRLLDQSDESIQSQCQTKMEPSIATPSISACISPDLMTTTNSKPFHHPINECPPTNSEKLATIDNRTHQTSDTGHTATQVHDQEKWGSPVSSTTTSGFKTAGGKNISIDGSHLSSIREIFDSIDTESSSIGSKLTASDSTKANRAKPHKENVRLPVSTTNCLEPGMDEMIVPSNCGTPIQETVPMEQQPAQRPFQGFCTANGDAVCIPESSLKIIHKLFDQDSEICNSEPLRLDNNKENGTHRKYITQAKLLVSSCVAPASFQAVNASVSGSGKMRDLSRKETTQQLQVSMGFSTASGASIDVSKSSREAIRLMFQAESSTASPTIQKQEAPLSASDRENGTSITGSRMRTPPPLRKPTTNFKSTSPLWQTSNSRRSSTHQSPNTPITSTKKFSFGNKPFKPHTPNRQNPLAKLVSNCRNVVENVHVPMSVPNIHTSPQQSDLEDPALTKKNKLDSEKLMMSLDQKPAQLMKPSKIMMKSEKSCASKRPMSELGQPHLSSYEDVPMDIQNITSRSARVYTFTRQEQFGDDMINTLQSLCSWSDITDFLKPPVDRHQLYRCFVYMDGVDPSLISVRWFDNHFRLIVWKLACLERAYPQIYSNLVTPLQVLKRMKHRYEREIDHSQRSVIKKILEGDDIPSKTMVLLISHISHKNMDNNDSNSRARSQTIYDVELTDGWYSLKAEYDEAFISLLHRGIVTEGTKIVVSGAQLVGLEQPSSPLDAPDSVKLKICTNSTRRARYHARLGLTKMKMNVSLSSLLPHGASAACLRIMVQRVYPLVFIEKIDGNTVIRNETKERQCQRLEALRLDKLMEQELNKENEEHQIAIKNRRHHTVSELREAYSGEQLLEIVNSSTDADLVQSMMTESQRETLFTHKQYISSERITAIRQRVSEKMRNNKHNGATPLLKIRVAGLHNDDVDNRTYTLLTIWRPSEEIISLLQEGSVFDAWNLYACEVRGAYRVNAAVLLSASRYSSFIRVYDVIQGVIDLVFEPREVVAIKDIHSMVMSPDTNDVDTSGVVVAWESANPKLTVVYLSDVEGKMLALKLWGGVEAQGYTDLLCEGESLQCYNLSYGTVRYGLPCLTVTELSVITARVNNNNTYTKQLGLMSKVARAELVDRCQQSLLRLATSYSELKSTVIMTSEAPATQQESSNSNPPNLHGMKKVIVDDTGCTMSTSDVSPGSSAPIRATNITSQRNTDNTSVQNCTHVMRIVHRTQRSDSIDDDEVTDSQIMDCC